MGVQTFQPLIVICRRGNFRMINGDVKCTSIHRSLSIPFRSRNSCGIAKKKQGPFCLNFVKLGRKFGRTFNKISIRSKMDRNLMADQIVVLRLLETNLTPGLFDSGF